MQPLEKKLGIQNPDWMMSCREKLCLIGILELLKPKRVIELGYHKGGATKWLSKYSKKVISVDVNEFIKTAGNDYRNIQAWNCPTQEAIKRIEEESLYFDLAIVDADHSRDAVAADVSGLLNHAEIILMHDSCNPECRRGMLDALTKQNSHAYYLDFITSAVKYDGLWGGLGIAYRSTHLGLIQEFTDEVSPYPMLALQNSCRMRPKLRALQIKCKEKIIKFLNRCRIVGGKILRR